MVENVRQREEQAMTGAEFRAIRKQVGWTQERLAEELGYSCTHIAHCEEGVAPILPRIAKQVLILSYVHELAVLLGLLEPGRQTKPKATMHISENSIRGANA
jgi:transcriptional regulator with XRE-family HTH domain